VPRVGSLAFGEVPRGVPVFLAVGRRANALSRVRLADRLAADQAVERKRVWLRADGRVLPDHVDPAQLIANATPVEHEYADITADAPRPAGLDTASTGTTPSASSRNAENNWPISSADKSRPRRRVRPRE
jgi:hypothetical protein